MGLDMYIENDWVELGYRRKFNALHWYIIENFGGGVDDCKPIPLTRANIVQILLVLKEIKKHPDRAETLFPTYGWFFFGTYEYDEHYRDDVKATIKTLNRILKEHPHDSDRNDIYYQSSW
jgi:hypothetical protein